MKKRLLIIHFLFIFSCDVSRELAPQNSLHVDDDGDLISNLSEIKRGLNPHIADIPKMNFQALDYAISAHCNLESSIWHFSFNQVIKPSSTRSFIEKIALDHFFKFNKRVFFLEEKYFENHLYWKVLSHISPKYHLQNLYIFEDESCPSYKVYTDIKVKIRLEEGNIGKIENLVFKFYYYDYVKEKLSLIEKISTFNDLQAGTTGYISFFTEHVPDNFIRNNYIKKGELFLVELYDYNIPELKQATENLYQVFPRNQFLSFIKALKKKRFFM